MFYAIIITINLRLKWTEKCREAGEANSSSLKVLLEYTGNVHFCTVCEIIFPVGGLWKSNVTLEKSLKSPWKKVAIFLINPVKIILVF